MTNGNGWGEIIPPKCVNCIHHKKTQSGTDYCDHTEYLDNIGCPVPYPYFFKEEYPCKGHKERMEK